MYDYDRLFSFKPTNPTHIDWQPLQNKIQLCIGASSVIEQKTHVLIVSQS